MNAQNGITRNIDGGNPCVYRFVCYGLAVPVHLLLAWLGARFDLSSAATIGVARSRRSYFWICSCQSARNGLVNNIWYVLVPFIKGYNHTPCWYILLQEAVSIVWKRHSSGVVDRTGEARQRVQLFCYFFHAEQCCFAVILIVCCAFWDFFALFSGLFAAFLLF